MCYELHECNSFGRKVLQKKKYFIISPKKIEIVPYLLKLSNLIQRNQFWIKLLHTEFCHFVMEKPAWSNESNSLFCCAPSVMKKPTGRLAQSGYHNAPPLVTKKLMDRISKKNLLSKICMVQYVQYLFLKAWMTQIPMNNYLL